jgi:hypothetical protein
MIFRSQDIEMYLVHDIWGHHWQAHLFPFEDQFRTSARFRRLPDLDHEVSGEAGWRGSMGATLEQASRWLAKGETLADNYWDPYLSAVFLDRLMISGVVAVAEMLADVSEYKLHVIGGEAAEYLTSSSYFSKWPTKLDLTLMDARVVFGMALEGFERFARASNTGGQLLRRLLLAYPDLEPEFAIKAVEAFRKRVREMLEQEFDLKLRCEQRGDQLLINPFTRLCLNLMGMHTALNDLYRELSDEEREYPVPLKDFRDLLLLSIAGFYQGAPQVNFWHLDEFTGLCFRDCLDRFCEALAEPTT